MISLHAQVKLTAYINGKIYTADTLQSVKQAVVTGGNKIIFTGNTDDALRIAGKGATVIDLQGKLMLPGFIDNHVHFMAGGDYLNGLDLRPAKSTKEFRELLKKYIDAHPESKWITGGDWDHEAWEIKDLPKKEWIDEFTRNKAVYIWRFDGHMALANSYALKLAGIDKNTPSPAGGIIEKDPVTGEPTGILKDNAMNLVGALVPASSEKERQESLESALKETARFGITSVHDITYRNDLKTYISFEKLGKLTTRIYTRIPVSEYKNLSDAGITYNFGSDLIKLGSLKAFADGSLGSSTAWFFDKYVQDTTTTGLPMDIITDGSLEKWAKDADLNKLQLSVHAIGDRANRYMIDLFGKIINENPQWDRRFRMEHAQHVRFEDIPLFKKYGVIASAQPYHAIDDGVWAEKRIGEKRTHYTYPFRSFIDAGVLLCFGSDWTVAPINPLLGIYAAVTRQTLDGKNPGGWIPEQKITVEEAVKCYTINNAYAAFAENELGSIEPGKFADLVILKEDIFTINPEKIKDVKVWMTVFNGKPVFKSE